MTPATITTGELRDMTVTGLGSVNVSSAAGPTIRTQAAPTSLHPDDLADLQRSKLTDTTIATMGCFSADPDTIRRLTGVNRVESSGYAIPYAGLWDQTGQPYRRWRLRQPVGSMRYVSGLSDDPQLYVPHALPDLHATDLLVITEGEKKAVKAVQEGISCVGLQGVWSWCDAGLRAAEKVHGEAVSEDTAPLKAILEVARKYQCVLVLGDSDLLGNRQANKGLHLLTRALVKRGIRAVLAHCPPRTALDERGPILQKQGLDDWLVADRAAALRSIPVLFLAGEIAREGITDSYSARTYAARVTGRLAYSQGIWRDWTGSVWSKDDCGRRLSLMADVRDSYRAAADTLAALLHTVLAPFAGRIEKEPEEVRAWADPLGRAVSNLRKAAERLGGIRAIEAAVTLATPLLRVADDAWDRDPHLLAVHNGVVDLRTGGLHPAQPEQRMTRMAGSSYDPQATAPKFEHFLEQVQPDPEIRQYLQRLAGYCALGTANEQKLFVFVGGGANGKTTFVSLLKETLGSCAVKGPVSLLAEQSADRPRNDIASLAGARMVTISETPQNLKLDEATVKNLTSQDVISARLLHKEFFEFRPCFTPLLDTNHAPRPREGGEAIWRRLVIVPWPILIPEQQRDCMLRDRLLEELPGILTWIVEGAALYLSSGLKTPAVLVGATQELRDVCDDLGQWMQAETVADSRSQVQSSQLYAAFRQWNEREGNRYTMAPRTFSQQLNDRGWRKRKAGGLMMWAGLRLRTDRDRVSTAIFGGCEAERTSGMNCETRPPTKTTAKPTANYAVLAGGSVRI